MDGKGTIGDEALIPLALAVNPDLLKSLKQMFGAARGTAIGGGEYHRAVGEEIVELGELAPDQFKRWMQGGGAAVQRHEAKAAEIPSAPVTVEQDERLQRIREQVQASKRWRRET
jgi:hypothetical protein